MKNHRIMPLLVSATLFSSLGLSSLAPSALAQSDAAVAGKTRKKTRTKGSKASKGNVSKKMLAKIEQQMGKPLTDDQKARLQVAYKTRIDAQKAAMATFSTEVGAITGLTEEQVKEVTKRGSKAGGTTGKMAPANR